MALDPRIPMMGQPIQLNSPLNMLARAQGVQNMQQQNQLQAMQMQDMHDQRRMQIEQAQARQQALANLPPPPDDAPDELKFAHQAVTRGLMPIEKYLEIAGPEVSRTVEVQGPDGKVYTQQLNKRGQAVGAPLPKFIEPKLIDNGQTIIPWTPTTPLPPVQKMATPDAQLSANTARRGQDLAETRESAPTWDATNQVWVNRRTQTVTPSSGQGAAQPKLTEDQGKASGWLVQAENAFTNMKSAMTSKTGKPTGADAPGFPDVVAAVPSFGVSGVVAQIMRGPDRQKFMQASSSLSEALLRAATGAGITKDEATQKIREITPQIGDSEALRQQKLAAIPLYIESLKVRAGPGAKSAANVIENKPVPVSGWSIQKVD